MKILLVDDMEHIRVAVKEFLEHQGVEVDVAVDGDEALRVFEERGPYTLVLTDLKHPGLPAVDLIAAIHSRHPQQAVIIATGFPVFRKPYTLESLLVLVTTVSKQGIGGTA